MESYIMKDRQKISRKIFIPDERLCLYDDIKISDLIKKLQKLSHSYGKDSIVSVHTGYEYPEIYLTFEDDETDEEVIQRHIAEERNRQRQETRKKNKIKKPLDRDWETIESFP